MIRFFIALIFLSLSTPSFAMGNFPSEETGHLIGNPAPEFTLETTANKSQNLAEVRDGKRTILVFWATWCPHCHHILKVVKQEIGVLKGEGINVVLVNVGETKEEALAYLQHKQTSLDSFVDEDNTVAGQYGVVGVPSVFFIDDKGTIRSKLYEIPSDYQAQFK